MGTGNGIDWEDEKRRRFTIAFRTYIDANGITLEAIAEYLEVSVEYVDSQINGPLGIRLDVLASVAHLTGTTPQGLSDMLGPRTVPTRQHTTRDLRERHDRRRRHR